MDISIIIPVRERLGILAKTLECLKNQKGLEELTYEVIVVDNGSKENIKEVFNSYCSYMPMKLVNACEKYHNRSYVRNRGIEVSKGEVIVSLDGDILLLEDSIRGHYDCVMENDENVSIGFLYFMTFLPSYLPRNSNEVSEWLEKEGKRGEIGTATDFESASNSAWIYGTAGNMAVSRKLLIKSGYFEEKFTRWGYEDTEFSYRAMKNAAIFVNNKNAIGIHFPHCWMPFNRIAMAEMQRVFLTQYPIHEIEILASGKRNRYFELNHRVDEWRNNSIRYLGEEKEKFSISIGDHREINVNSEIKVSCTEKAEYDLIGFKLPFREKEFEKGVMLPSWRRLSNAEFIEVLLEFYRAVERVYIICLKEDDFRWAWRGTEDDVKNMLVENFSLNRIREEENWVLFEICVNEWHT